MIDVTYQITLPDRRNTTQPHICIHCLANRHCVFIPQARKLEKALRKETRFTVYVRVRTCTQYHSRRREEKQNDLL